MRKLTLPIVLAIAAAVGASAARADLPARCSDNPAYANVRLHCFDAAALGGAGEGRVRFSVSGSFHLRATAAVFAAIDAPGSTLRIGGVIAEDDIQAPVGVPTTSAPPVGGKLLLARTLRIDGNCATLCYLELVARHYAFSVAGSGEIDVSEAADSGAGIRSSRNERLVVGDREGLPDPSGGTLVFWGDAPYTNCNFTFQPCQGTTGHGIFTAHPRLGRIIQLGRETGLSFNNPVDAVLWNVSLRWPFYGC